ncbi:MAG: hypothetical protein HYV09_21440 [Deltaproteobacteria bacterium]|nr:hypothetical protein [Deltaproteobacteria bacterium]
MRFVSAHDLKTGAAFVLPDHARCVQAKPALYRHEVDQAIDHAHVDPLEIRPIGTCPAGSIVYAEWRPSQWIKLRVIPSSRS